ncbi:MAG TPA: sensor histidine kinase [Spirochaetia bacterium]|nr:sensor histidine kinase [Spirochaetia bacterium]
MTHAQPKLRLHRMNRTTFSLFLRYLVIVLIPIFVLLVMGAVSIFVNQDYVSRQISASNFKTLVQIEDSVELTFEELDSIAISFSASPEFLSSLNEIISTKELNFDQSKVLNTIRNFLNVSAYARPYVQSIYVYIQNNGNRLLTTNDGIVSLDSFYDSQWVASYKQHLKDDGFWTQTRSIVQYPSVETAVRVLTIYRRIFYLIGIKEPGVVLINIRLDYFRNLIDRLKSDPSQGVLIVDPQGKPIISASDREMSADLLQLKPKADARPLQYRVVFGGKPYVVNQTRSPKYDWTYISLTPLSLFYRTSTALRDINIAIVAISFVLGALLTFYMSRRSFRHIENVVGIVEAAERGTPLPAIPEEKSGGYGHLSFTILRTFLEHEYMKVQLSERKYRQRTLELLALHSQMNPHFLFNTLETINWRVIELTKRPNQINDMIKNLSNILKYSLESPFKLETLENELSHAEDYLNIQRIRYKNKFSVVRDTPPELGGYKVIRFLLQPLLENAIYHGIKEKEGSSTIFIGAQKIGSTLQIVVEDNGRGMNGQQLASIRNALADEASQTERVGLQNTNRRIRLAYGEPNGITVESTFGEGTRVTILLPARLS